MLLHIDTRFQDVNAFGLQELFLERSVRLANEDFAVRAKDAVPGYSFALRSRAHSPAHGASAAA